jgi:hypothetical protein
MSFKKKKKKLHIFRHNQIYPIGYKCEVMFSPKKSLIEKAGDTPSASMPRKAICEINQIYGRPEFTILDTFNNEKYSSQIEADLWKKVMNHKTMK